jgi:hypothetical protein
MVTCIYSFVHGLLRDAASSSGSLVSNDRIKAIAKLSLRKTRRRIGGRGMAPRVINFGARWRSEGNITARHLYSEKKLRYMLHGKLNGAQSRF